MKRFFIILLMIFVLYPIIFGLLISLYPNNELSGGIHSFSIMLVNIKNYKLIFKNDNYPILLSLFYTFLISFSSSIVIITSSFFIGFYISRNKELIINLPYKKKIVIKYFPLFLAIFIYSIPSIFYATYWRWNPNSVIFISLQFILSHFNYLFPFVLLLSVNYFKYIPYTFDRQAAMDGISNKYFITRIIFPYFRPVLLFLSLIVFVIVFNDVLFSTFIANKEEYKFIGHYLVEYFYNTDQSFYQYGTLSAYGVLIMIFLIIISVIIILGYHKYIEKELKNNI